MLRAAALAAALLVVLPAPDVRAQTSGEPEEFTAFAVNMGARTGGGSGQVIINVTRWSPESERAKLVTTLKEKGPEALLEELRDTRRTGTIRTPDSLGYALHYAHQMPLEEGARRIVIVTDRPIGFWEATNRPRSIDYPFTVIEMRIKPDGTGEGKMSIAARIDAAGDTILIENYDTQPVHLNSVQTRKTKR